MKVQSYNNFLKVKKKHKKIIFFVFITYAINTYCNRFFMVQNNTQ